MKVDIITLNKKTHTHTHYIHTLFSLCLSLISLVQRLFFLIFPASLDVVVANRL